MFVFRCLFNFTNDFKRLVRTVNFFLNDYQTFRQLPGIGDAGHGGGYFCFVYAYSIDDCKGVSLLADIKGSDWKHLAELLDCDRRTLMQIKRPSELLVEFCYQRFGIESPAVLSSKLLCDLVASVIRNTGDD